MSRSLTLLVICLFYLGLSLFSTRAAAKTSRIFLVVWSGCDTRCNGFADHIARQKQSIEIILRDAQGDRTKFSGFIAEAKKRPAEMVVASGEIAAVAMFGTGGETKTRPRISHIPALFMGVRYPVRAGLLKSEGVPWGNRLAVPYRMPEEDQLSAANHYRPFSKIGYIYNPAEQKSLDQLGLLRDLAKQQGWHLIEKPLPLDPLGNPAAHRLPGLIGDLASQNPQWIYQGTGTFMTANRALFIQTAVTYRLPVVAAQVRAVRNSEALIGTYGSDYHDGLRTARLAREILVSGHLPAQVPDPPLALGRVVLNISIAKQVGLYPPLLMLKHAEVIRDEK